MSTSESYTQYNSFFLFNTMNCSTTFSTIICHMAGLLPVSHISLFNAIQNPLHDTLPLYFANTL